MTAAENFHNKLHTWYQIRRRISQPIGEGSWNIHGLQDRFYQTPTESTNITDMSR